MKPIVFLGPSLPLAEAKNLLDATYRPPVSMGDVYRATLQGPTVIAIVDGLFEQTPAVWHKEILFALSRGVRVLGASSMGALRAAELAAFGMEGVGQVFDAFHSGELNDDDEVTIAHAAADDGYRPLSDAMVNIRAGLRAAREAQLIGVDAHDRLLAAAKGMPYWERSWGALWTRAGELGIAAAELETLRAHVERTRPDVKRADAIALLQRLQREQEGLRTGGDEAPPTPPRPAAFDFEPTYFWEQMILVEDAVEAAEAQTTVPTSGSAAEAVTLEALRRHVRLYDARARPALQTALLLYLADRQAKRHGLPRGPEAIDALLKALADEVNRRLPKALERLGDLPATVRAVKQKQLILRELGLRAVSPADAGLTLEQLLAWHERKLGPLVGSADEHAAAAGFTSVEEFIAELVLEYLAQNTTAPA